MEREAGHLYSAARLVAFPTFRFLWRLHVEGLENVPASGPAIIAPNHNSVMDSFILPCVLPRRITYIGKAEYLDSWKTKYLFPALGMIPIDRTGGDTASGALDAAERVLSRGELFGIYPEGTRSRTGRLHKGHTGPARLALRTGAPIVPVALLGTRDIQPPDASMPRPFRAAVIRFGRPIAMDRYRDHSEDRLAPRQIIDEVMFEIRSLSGQEYDNTYASRSAAAPSILPAEELISTGRSSVSVLRPTPLAGAGTPPRVSTPRAKAPKARDSTPIGEPAAHHA